MNLYLSQTDELAAEHCENSIIQAYKPEAKKTR